MVSLHGSIHIRLSASLSPEGSNIGHLETWASGKTGSPVMIVRHSVLQEEKRRQGLDVPCRLLLDLPWILVAFLTYSDAIEIPNK